MHLSRLITIIVVLGLAAGAVKVDAVPTRRKMRPDMSIYQGTTADHDFNGDKYGDLLFMDPKTRSLDATLQIGTHAIGNLHIGTLDNSGAVEAFGDFDDDGIADLVVRNSDSGQVSIWLVSKSGAKIVPLRTCPSGFRIAGLGDFDGDGNRDLLLRNDQTKTTVVWFLQGVSFGREATLPDTMVNLPAAPGHMLTLGPRMFIGGVGDIDGDGRTDIVWIDRETNHLLISFVVGDRLRGGIDQGPVTAGYELEAVADFDGDRKADLLFRNKKKNRWVLSLLNATSIKKMSEMDSVEDGTLAAVCDLNFDGTSDLVFQETDGSLHWYILKGTTYYKGTMQPEKPGLQLIGTR
jgi:hypothetical protein